MKIEFKNAGIQDLDKLLILMHEYFDFHDLPFDVPAARSALQELLLNPRLGKVWVIEADTRPVGYLALYFVFNLQHHGRNAVVEDIYLKGGYMGQGVRGMALQHVEKFCVQTGIQAIFLQVNRADLGAQDFYRNVGYAAQDYLLMSKHFYR